MVRGQAGFLAVDVEGEGGQGYLPSCGHGGGEG